MLKKRHFTHDSFLAEKDVDNSNVLLPRIVEVLLSGLCDKYVIPVLPPHRAGQGRDVGWIRIHCAVVGLLHLDTAMKFDLNVISSLELCGGKPASMKYYRRQPVFWQVASVQCAEGAQIEVSRVARPEIKCKE